MSGGGTEGDIGIYGKEVLENERASSRKAGYPNLCSFRGPLLHDEMLDCASEHIRSLCVLTNSNFVLRSLEVSHVSFDMHGT